MMLVGDRLNGEGSREAKRLLLAGDYGGLVAIAREQVRLGAQVLDLCVMLRDRPGDEADLMEAAVQHLSAGVDAPLMIDSTDPAVVGRALGRMRRRGFVNSVSLEHGRARLDAIVPSVKRHGSALVALCINEHGMARTAARKLEIARRIREIVVGEHGLPPDKLFIDPLAFPITAGRPAAAGSARETIQAIREIGAALPGLHTILGISNIGFGLPRALRAVLQSVFLHHCAEAGLDAAIANPGDGRDYAGMPAREREAAENLVFNRHPEALEQFVEAVSTPAPAR